MLRRLVGVKSNNVSQMSRYGAKSTVPVVMVKKTSSFVSDVSCIKLYL